MPPAQVANLRRNPASYASLGMRAPPRRYAEWETVYRYERSGAFHGLFRVRECTCDDVHIFCTPQHACMEIGWLGMTPRKFVS